MESEREKFTPELKEEEPKTQELIVDFVRHGGTEYTEEFPDITERGKEEIRATAEQIAATIDPQQEIVVFWSSSAMRAKGSAEVMKQVFEKHGIEIAKQSSISSLRQMEVKDPDFIFNLFDKIIEEGKNPEEVFLEHETWAGEKSEKVETRTEIQKRIDRIMNYLRYAAEHINTQGKRLRIIGTTHFETMQPLIQEIFGKETGELLKTGEDFEIRMKHNRNTGDTEVEFSFRGKEKRGYHFDKETRKFTALDSHD
ncbi:MAG: histidine phosphatase family protein [Patescibacteria group bacterium]